MPGVDFEARWAVIEAFIEAEAIDPDPNVVAAMRESVRFGEAPEIAGPELGLPAVAGPELGLPALAGPELGLPAVAGPELGLPASVPNPLTFASKKAAEEAHQLMEDLAEEMMIEDD